MDEQEFRIDNEQETCPRKTLSWGEYNEYVVKWNKPIFEVTYLECPMALGYRLEHQSGFTPGKSYPVYEECVNRTLPFGRDTFYFLIDDNGKKRKVLSNYFYLQDRLSWDAEWKDHEMVNVRDEWVKKCDAGVLSGWGYHEGVFEIDTILREQQELLNLALDRKEQKAAAVTRRLEQQIKEFDRLASRARAVLEEVRKLV